MAQLESKPATPLLVLEAGRLATGYWAEVWRYRELAFFLATRDILVRYKQTVAGVAWSVVRPVVLMVALTWAFRRGAGLTAPDKSIPYALWVFAGVLPWQLFADALSASSNSLVAQSTLVSKIYFPRVVLPASRVVVSFLDACMALLALVILMITYHFTSYGFVPAWQIIFLPIWLLISGVAALGLGLWFAPLNVRFRDFTYIIPFVISVSLYLSPVGMSTANYVSSDARLRILFSLNPLVGVVDGARFCIFGARAPLFWPGQLASLFSSTILFWSGLRFFRAREPGLADVI